MPLQASGAKPPGAVNTRSKRAAAEAKVRLLELWKTLKAASAVNSSH